jgi:hypothetical protein
MINALIGAASVALPLLLLGVLGYGKLLQTVKDQPKLMRLEMKLEIKGEIERHVAQYAHEKNSGVQPIPQPLPEQHP